MFKLVLAFWTSHIYVTHGPRQGFKYCFPPTKLTCLHRIVPQRAVLQKLLCQLWQDTCGDEQFLHGLKNSSPQLVHEN